MSLITPHGWKDSSIQKAEKPTLVISKLLMRQIQDMCSRTPNGIEWSGPFFYKEVEGDISKPENLVLSGEFLYPMDIGSAAYTEYEMLPRPGTNSSPFVKWAMKHIIGKGLQTGHIHSHHNMRVWFSGTDMTELEQGSACHNYYLSLIVNNKYEMIAKIGILLEAEIEQELSFFKKITQGYSMSHKGQTYKRKITQLIQYDVDIKVPEVDSLPTWYMNAFNELIKPKQNSVSLVNRQGFISGHEGVQTSLFNQAQKPFVWEADESEGTPEDLLREILSFDLSFDRLAEAIGHLRKEHKKAKASGTEDEFLSETAFYAISNFEDAFQIVYPTRPIEVSYIHQCKDIVDDMKADPTTIFISEMLHNLIYEYTSQ